MLVNKGQGFLVGRVSSFDRWDEWFQPVFRGVGRFPVRLRASVRVSMTAGRTTYQGSSSRTPVPVVNGDDDQLSGRKKENDRLV